MMKPAAKVPRSRAFCGLPPSLTRTKKVQPMLTTMPAPAMNSGQDDRG
jgi:hypothetical protein